MKKMQRKDILRNIWKQRVSFLSIIIIAVLGVTTFLGIDFTAQGLRKNGSALYNRLNFRDIEVVSTLLLSQEDIEDLSKIEGVEDVEPVRLTTAEATFNTASESIQVISLTERINLPDLREGNIPAGMTECAVEQQIADHLHLKPGNQITLSNSDGTKARFLKETQFTVTAIVNHPDHTNNIVDETPYVLVTMDAFGGDELQDCFMKAEIQIQKPENSNRFSKKYEKSVAAVLERIDALALTAAPRRDKALMNGIEDPQKALSDGFDQIEEGKEQIRQTIRDVIQEIAPEGDPARLIQWATPRKANLEDPNETAKYLWLTDNFRIDLSRSPEEIFGSIVDSKIVSAPLQAAIYGTIQYLNGEDVNIPRNGDGTLDMETIRAELIEAATGSEAVTKFQTLSDGCKQWDEAHAQLLAFSPCRWLSFDGKGNASFAQMIVGSQNFSNLKSTFSLMFILVGALVIFATVGKMVDEQRRLIGTTKALGFFTSEIFVKYLTFGVSATVIGIFLGTLIARFGIAPFLLHGFNKYYYFNVSKSHLFVDSTLIVFVFGVLLAAGAVFVACRKLLREPAIRLMQPKAPASRNKSARRGKPLLSLYSRLILSNIRTDMGRVIVTIVSIAGCCALVIIGFTLKSSVTGSLNQQFDHIIEYDFTVKYDTETSVDGGREFGDLLAAAGTQSESVYNANVTYRFSDLQIAELLCGDIAKINQYYHLDDWKTGNPLRPNDWGVLIPRRVAETSHLSVGSEFEIALGGTKTATVVVSGIFENYIGRTFVMSGEYYEKVFGEAYQPNAYMVKLGNADAKTLENNLKAKDGFETIVSADSNRSIIETSMSMLNTVVVLFIFIAGVMAGVVQLNLTNMYVLQKKREMTVMRINGFTVKEVIGYILRETVFTTILGILLGIAAGAAAGYSIVRTLEQSFMQLDRSIDLTAWLLGAALTVVFTVIVNAIALRNVKNLRLTDVA